MKCLITGVNGFAASHLADHLLKEGHEVVGTIRIRTRLENISHLNLKTMSMDLHDCLGVHHVIKSVKPDAVFHLAAQSFVGWAWNHPEETIKTNVLGTLYLLEAVREECPGARVHIASSSQVYGKMFEPMGKDTLFNPMNPYDTSKLSQDMLALQYFNSYGLNIIRTRAFNISGPRRGESFAESSWANQIAEIEIGKREPVIKHGNLESARDYIDVRDVVKCYARACFEGEPGGLYILGAEKAIKMGDILATLLNLSATKKIRTEEDPERMRPSDTPWMQAKDSVLKEWCGELIPFKQTMKDLLDYWRQKA